MFNPILAGGGGAKSFPQTFNNIYNIVKIEQCYGIVSVNSLNGLRFMVKAFFLEISPKVPSWPPKN